jgi:hypothetical protein
MVLDLVADIDRRDLRAPEPVRPDLVQLRLRGLDLLRWDLAWDVVPSPVSAYWLSATNVATIINPRC